MKISLRHFRRACLLLVLVVCSSGCSEERAKWNAARATVEANTGNCDDAIALLMKAMEQDPENGAIRLKLARMLAADGDGELGKTHCDIYIDKHPSDLRAYQVRSECFQYLGRFEEALADYIKSISDHVDRSTRENNDLAYFRGLANLQLSRALDNIEEAIEEVEGRYWGSRLRVPLEVQGIVASSILARHVDFHLMALDRLNQKISSLESGVRSKNLLLRDRITSSISTRERDVPFPLDNEIEDGLNFLRAELESSNRSLVMLLATRALIHEDLREHAKCDQDRSRISELGYEFGEIAEDLPSELDCISTLETSSAFLDTRGFVLSRLNWNSGPDLTGPPKRSSSTDQDEPIVFSSYKEALDDMNTAILAAETHRKILESSLYNSPDIPVMRVKRLKLRVRHTVAVLLNHRMALHRRGGFKQLAERDQSRIIELGFKAGECLY